MPTFTFKKELAEVHYFWTLSLTDKGLWLEVLCGRSAVFIVSFLLNEEERHQYETKGNEAIQNLAYRVQGSPGTFQDRNVD